MLSDDSYDPLSEAEVGDTVSQGEKKVKREEGMWSCKWCGAAVKASKSLFPSYMLSVPLCNRCYTRQMNTQMTKQELELTGTGMTQPQAEGVTVNRIIDYNPVTELYSLKKTPGAAATFYLPAGALAPTTRTTEIITAFWAEK